MARVDNYPQIIHKRLSEQASIPYSHGQIKSSVIMDAEQTQFLLMDEGWDGKKRVHGCLIHVEIRDDKIWIHRDGTEDGITDDLVAAGVPKEHIVLAFHPEYLREHTGYAIA